MERLHEVIALNNHGVHHLMDGSGTNADGFRVFHSALAVGRTLVEHVIHPIENIGLYSPEISCFDQRPASLSELQDGYFYVYDRAILLSMDVPTLPMQNDDLAGHMVHAAIIFNLALVSHREGKRTGREDDMSRACRLYDLVTRLLDSTNVDACRALGVLKCLALNNCAGIHYEQCDYGKSRSCLDVLEYQLATSSNAHLETFLDVAEVDELRMNLEYREPPVMTGAA